MPHSMEQDSPAICSMPNWSPLVLRTHLDEEMNNTSKLDLSIDINSDSELILTPPKAHKLVKEICDEAIDIIEQDFSSSSSSSLFSLGREVRGEDMYLTGTETCQYIRKKNKFDGITFRQSKSDKKLEEDAIHLSESPVISEIEDTERLSTFKSNNNLRTVNTQCHDVSDFYRIKGIKHEYVAKLLKLSYVLLTERTGYGGHFSVPSLDHLLEKEGQDELQKLKEDHCIELLKIKEEHKKDIIDLQDRMLKWMCSRVDLVRQQESTILQLNGELESIRSCYSKLKKKSNDVSDKGIQCFPLGGSVQTMDRDNSHHHIMSEVEPFQSPKFDKPSKDMTYNEYRNQAAAGMGGNISQPAHVNSCEGSVISKLTIYDTATAEKLFKDLCYNNKFNGNNAKNHYSTRGMGSHGTQQQGYAFNTHTDDDVDEDFVDAIS